jgi:hypothetical protein
MSFYNHRKLEYEYLYRGINEREAKTGHGHYEFHGTGGSVWTYNGYFYDDQAPEGFYVYGRRLRSYLPDSTEYRDACRPEHRSRLMKRFMEEMENEFSTNVAQEALRRPAPTIL